MRITRRHFLGSMGAAASLVLWPSLSGQATPASVAGTRLLVVLLRGALDGLHAMPPLHDPHYTRLRGALAVQEARPLEGGFGLHPALGTFARLSAQGQLLPVLAVAPPYRQRSHFDAQDCLENGTARPHGASTGWLNRCGLALGAGEALAMAAVTPLIVRGPGAVRGWSPPLPQEVDPLLLQRLQPLYAADPVLSGDFDRALEDGRVDADARMRGGRLARAMEVAAGFMAAADGPRLGFVEDSGWDTHSQQAPVLARKLAELDAGLRAFRDGSGAGWSRTVVAVVTEFGRTAAANGTAGTDHGTGGLAFLAGGAVRGGRVAGDWPGLAPADLNEGRDLRATSDLRALFKGVLGPHLGLAESVLETQVFPDSRKVRALDGLLA